EGLEDATALLLRLSRSCSSTRIVVLRLLLNGGRELGFIVCHHIRALVDELKTLNAKHKELLPHVDPPSADGSSPEKMMGKGMLHDRFTNTAVVITAPTNVKHNI